MKVLSFFRYIALVLGFAAILCGCDKEPVKGPEPEPEDKELTFVFTVNNVTAQSVKFDIEVSDDEVRYALMYTKKSEADKFQDDEALFKDDMDYFVSLWNDDYETLGDVLKDYTAVGDHKGLVIEGLEPETEYLFYAYGLELNGKRTTDIHREYITTKAVEKTELAFEIDAVVDGLVIDVSVTPSDNDTYYYFDAIEKRSIDIDFDGDVAAAAKYYIDYNVMVGTYYGMTTEEVMLELASKGPDQYLFECAPVTEYVIFAMAVSLDGNVVSELTTKNVVSGDIVLSDNVITFNVDAVSSTSVTVSSTTTNDDPYFLGIEPVSKFRGMNDEQIMEFVCAEYGEYIDWSTEYGNVDRLELVDLQPDTEYLLMAFGVQYGYPTTSLLKMNVRTGASSNPADCTFEVTFNSVTETSADITVTPSLGDVKYYWDLGMSFITDEAFVTAFNETINEYIEAGEVSSVIEYWRYMGYMGEDTWEFTDLEPGTEYEVFITPIDMTTGEMITPVIRVPFTTSGAAEPTKSAGQYPVIPFRKIDFHK